MLKEIIESVSIKVVLEIIFKTFLCVVLVGAIGYNREKKGMVVGIRTHVLVGMVGLLIQITSLEYYRINGGNNDVFRLAGQYISGIGFLGAGTILKDKRSVKGLTTAASICLAACIGLAVGSGVYLGAVIITVVSYIFLTDIFRLKKIMSIKRNSYVFIEVELTGDTAVSMEKVRNGLKIAGVCIVSIETRKVSIDKAKIILKLNVDDEVDINDILSEITYIDEVSKVEFIG
ncbi:MULTISPECIES: MgtC/SapB family protein [Clostridia]|jgi:putative Mg2+ transporter-C (MgtC) family protein|uniref:MgtC/SapB family protein n=3 Tax=Clostridia TaxID=186801 RepID=A0A8I0ADG9_9CLOT|nr:MULTISPECIES: MgtC/SapB family protein [Clostridia]MBC5639725.1 MgtC/SapB family protein [Clostridium lentum]MBC5653958.1 MgtC/SapB family protein [Blautia lenta]CDB74030.1 mgtC/SapB transporter [Clostridium sp. CAG:265]